MTLRKRLYLLWIAATQSWHEKTCAECGSKWMAVGPHTELIAICDACELAEMERFQTAMEARFQREMKGVW